MADLSVTAGNVAASASATVVVRTAGGTITAGQPVYEDSSDSFHCKPAQADTSAKANAIGIALNGAADGQPVSVCTAGDINVGATLTVGEVYVVSDAAAGGIAPVGDLASDDYVSVLGVASTASNLKLKLNVSGAQVP